MDRMTLQMALVGYEIQRKQVEEKIGEIRARLNGKKAPGGAVKTEKATPKRKMSAAARARIASAQKKRWAEFHKRAAENKG